MKNKNDLRIKRTYKLLSEALLDLLKTTTFENIKVTDICEKAMVHRTTFYSHFEDKYQLLDYIIQDLQKELHLEVRKAYDSSDIAAYYIHMATLFLSHLALHKDFYKKIILNNHSSITMDIVFSKIVADVTTKLEKETTFSSSTIPPVIMANFYVGAVFSTILVWLKDDVSKSEEEIITYLKELIPQQLEQR